MSKRMSRYNDRSGIRKSTAICNYRQRVSTGYQNKRISNTRETSRSKSRPKTEKTNIISKSMESAEILAVSDEVKM